MPDLSDIRELNTGFVTVPKKDIKMINGAPLFGFKYRDRDYTFYSIDPYDRKRVLYKDDTID